MGNTSSQQELANSIQRQSEFEHWKLLGNETAVQALSNSDTLAWPALEKKLKQALSYYHKTPSFEMIYQHKKKDEILAAMAS